MRVTICYHEDRKQSVGKISALDTQRLRHHAERVVVREVVSRQAIATGSVSVNKWHEP